MVTVHYAAVRVLKICVLHLSVTILMLLQFRCFSSENRDAARLLFSNTSHLLVSLVFDSIILIAAALLRCEHTAGRLGCAHTAGRQCNVQVCTMQLSLALYLLSRRVV
jgi:hypothetical protein